MDVTNGRSPKDMGRAPFQSKPVVQIRPLKSNPASTLLTNENVPDSYYDGVRLPASVHHQLRLLAFPMRTRSAHGLWSDAGPPKFRRDPFARDVALDPGGTTMPRMTALPMLRSTMKTVSAPASRSFR